MVFSFVPSWTETLLAADVKVVGRTRFCIHPKDLVKKVSPLGGTKNFAPDLIEKTAAVRDAAVAASKVPTAPSFVAILDREENPQSFYDELLGLDITPIVTHVESLQSLPIELLKLSQDLNAPGLLAFKARFERVLENRANVRPERALQRLVLKASTGVEISSILEAKKFAYIIWKKPWMCVSHQTLIAEVLEFVLNRPVGSAEDFLYAPKGSKYPELECIPDGVLPLYSSEPYPFLNEIPELPKGLFVNGELYSWFGIRLLRFLEDVLEASK